MGQIVLLFAVLCSALLCAETQFHIGRKIQFRKLAMCPGKRGMPLLFDNVVFARDEHGATTAINFKLYVRRQVEKLAIDVSFWKCDASGSLDSCEYFLKDYNASSICQIMGKKNQLWTSFMDHFTMPSECPIKVGNYTLKDGPLEENSLNYLPIPNAFWKVNLKGYDSGAYISCVDVEFEVYNGRRPMH